MHMKVCLHFLLIFINYCSCTRRIQCECTGTHTQYFELNFIWTAAITWLRWIQICHTTCVCLFIFHLHRLNEEFCCRPSWIVINGNPGNKMETIEGIQSPMQMRKRMLFVHFCKSCASILNGIPIGTYLPLYGPSTFFKLPSPDTTATRSLPLNHFTECKFPHFFTSIGHSNSTVLPRGSDIVLSVQFEKKERERKIKSVELRHKIQMVHMWLNQKINVTMKFGHCLAPCNWIVVYLYLDLSRTKQMSSEWEKYSQARNTKSKWHTIVEY